VPSAKTPTREKGWKSLFSFPAGRSGCELCRELTVWPWVCCLGLGSQIHLYITPLTQVRIREPVVSRDGNGWSSSAAHSSHRHQYVRCGPLSRRGVGRGALAGHVKVVELLSVEKFADVINKASDSDGATPLMRCCESGALDCAQLLVERGADINAENIRNGARSVSLSSRRSRHTSHSYTTTRTRRLQCHWHWRISLDWERPAPLYCVRTYAPYYGRCAATAYRVARAVHALCYGASA